MAAQPLTYSKTCMFSATGWFFLAGLAALMLRLAGILSAGWLGSVLFDLLFAYFAAAGALFCFQGAIIAGKLRKFYVTAIVILGTSLLLLYVHLAVFISIRVTVGMELLGSMDFEAYTEIIPLILRNTLMILTMPVELLEAVGYILGSGLRLTAYLLSLSGGTLLIPLAAARQSKEPFSEELNQWLERRYGKGHLSYFMPEERWSLETALQQGDGSVLLQRQRVVKNTAKYGLLCFYKVKGENTGKITLCNLEHKHIRNREYHRGKYKFTEFLPPYTLTKEQADQLETYVNSGISLEMDRSADI